MRTVPRDPLNIMFFASSAFGSAAFTTLSTGSDSPVIMD